MFCLYTIGADIMCYHVGVSGNILISDQAYRLPSYNIWGYTEGLDSFYDAMLIDLTQAPGEVSQSHFRYFIRE